MGISGEKKARYTEGEHGAFNLNVDSLDAEGYEMDKQRLQMYVGRYITNAKVFENVYIGVFHSKRKKIKVKIMSDKVNLFIFLVGTISL